MICTCNPTKTYIDGNCPTHSKHKSARKENWPSQDDEGNNLRHAEDCAWRFGMKAKCDCGLDAKPPNPTKGISWQLR